MSDIRQWLEELGLGVYADVFEENAIDGRALPHLTDQDLKDIGISLLGHRRVLLGAIMEISPTAKPDTAADDNKTAPRDKPAVPDAERRQLTVMFCDLVGSTTLSEQLDPEELRALMQRYQQACGEVVARYDGHVAQYLGDGLMVYLGWPTAHEDDAERAIRAGLEIVDAVKAVEAPNPLSVRIGIATGQVVVGETGAGDASVPKAAVGETPNLAARVQGTAGADEVVVAASTHRLVGGTFDYENRGNKALKGIAEPVPLWRVIGTRATEGRFEAQRTGGLTPLVGRDDEISMLLRRWQQAKDGEGQVVLLCGEAGIGKSRITDTLRQRLNDEPHTRLRLQCSPFHTSSAFYPLIQQFERGAGLDPAAAADTNLDKLESFIAQAGVDVAKAAPLFAAFLSLPIERYPSLNASPQKQKQLTIEALGDQLAGLAAKRPVVFIFEDVHWTDPTTLEVINEFIDRIEHTRALLVITYRPEFEPPWAGSAHVTTLTLNHLSHRQGAEMVAKVTGGKPLPAEVLDQIVANTDGIPLFVEELTKAVLGSGLLEEREEGYTLSGPLPPLAIPTTLQDSLMARLDRLSSVKGVAQAGACIGREFSYELLAAVSPMRDNELQEALQLLRNSELIYSRGESPNTLYIFKHALVQEAAYTSLLKGRRQEIHAQIAETLNQISPQSATNKPELLAHHYTKAGLAEPAIDYWLKAARKASARLAYVEARSNLDIASAQLDKIAGSEARDEYEIVVRIEQGELLRRSIGYAAPESGDAFKRAEQLLARRPNQRQRFRVNLSLGVYHANRADFSEAHRYLDTAKIVADESGEIDLRKVALHQKGFELLHIGKPAEGISMLHESAALYRKDREQLLRERKGRDPGAAVQSWIAQLNSYLGYADQMYEASDEAIELATTVDYPFLATLALGMGAIAAITIRDADRAIRLGDACMTLCADQRLPFWAGWARAPRGLGLAYNGKVDEALIEIEGAMADVEGLGGRNATAWFGTYLAEANVLAGRPEHALELLPGYERMIETSGQFILMPMINFVAGLALSALPAPDMQGAEAKFRQSMRIARTQHNKTYELRAAISLARLYAEQGERQEAYDCLFPIYDWFTEGFETTDLKAAKALLSELN